MNTKQTLPGAKRKVLFVNDNADWGEPFAELCSLNGYETEWYQNCNEALVRALKFEPDFVIIDLDLKNRTGFLLLSALRARSNFRITPIVAICANATDHFHEEILKAGFSRYFCKPVKFEQMDFYLKSFG